MMKFDSHHQLKKDDLSYQYVENPKRGSPITVLAYKKPDGKIPTIYTHAK